jgi:hypothetical protein
MQQKEVQRVVVKWDRHSSIMEAKKQVCAQGVIVVYASN